MNPTNSPTPSSPAGDSGYGGGATDTGAMTDTKNKIAQTAREAASKVKSVAANTAAKAKDQVSQIAAERKETAATRIGDYSSAVHESARALEDKDPNIAWFTHRAADKLQGVANYMRESDWNCLRGDCEGVARRHPAVFFGGMFFAGLVLGNMLKASGNKARYSNEEENLGTIPETDWTAPQSQSYVQPELPTSAPAAGI